MSEGYTKVLSSIRYSSIWRESDDVLRVWMTLLTMADQRGYVGACADGIAHESRTVTESRVIEILDMFQSPDPRSRSTEYEGRRIQKVDRGWLVLNYAKIRNMHSDGAERARKREWWASNRGKSKPLDASGASETLAYGSDSDLPSDSDLSSGSDIATSVPRKRNSRTAGPIPPPDPFVPTAATMRCAEKFKRDVQNDWEECRDWHLKHGTPVCDWQATLRTWLKKAPGFDMKQQSRSEQSRVSDPPETDVSCPKDLSVTNEQLEILRKMGIADWIIEAWTYAFVAKKLANSSDKRPLTVWRKCLVVAIMSDFQSGKRPQKPIIEGAEFRPPPPDDRPGWVWETGRTPHAWRFDTVRQKRADAAKAVLSKQKEQEEFDWDSIGPSTDEENEIA